MSDAINRIEFLRERKRQELLDMIEHLRADVAAGRIDYCALSACGPAIEYAIRAAGYVPHGPNERLLASGVAMQREAERSFGF